MPEKHLVIPACVQARLRWTVVAREVNVVVHYSNVSAVTVNPALATTVFDGIKALWTSQLAPFCPASTIFVGVGLRDLNSAGNAEQFSTSATAPGTAPSGEALPRQIAAVFTLRTARAGKSYRGRMYMPGFAESANDTTNRIVAAAKSAMDIFCQNYNGAFNVGGLTLGVAHRPTAFDEITGLPITPGLGFVTPVTQMVCRDTVWDTQRRRAG